MEGHSHKTTARALATRRLVKVSKSKGLWSAELTDDGRYYLDHDKFPHGQAVREAADSIYYPASHHWCRSSRQSGQRADLRGPSSSSLTSWPPVGGCCRCFQSDW